MRSRGLWAAVAVAILLRIAWIVIASSSSVPDYHIDEYPVRAQALQAGEPLALAFSDPPFGVLRPPLYVALLAVGFASGLSMFWLLVIQAFIGSSIVLAVYRLSLEIDDPSAGLIGAWLAACWPQWITAAATTSAEHIDTPLVCAALVYTVIAYRQSRARSGARAGALFGIAALCRSTSLYVAPLMALLVATKRRKPAAMMIATVLLLTLPYIAVISRSAGRVVVIENLLEWNWDVERELQVTERTGHSSVLGLPSSVAAVLARDGGAMVWSAFSRLKNVLFSEDFWEFPMRAQAPTWLLRWWSPVVALFLIALYGGALIGILRAKDRNGVLLLVAWIMLHCLVVLGSPAIEPRHRTPFEPALMALAAAGLARLYLLVRASGIGGAGRLAQW